jgi:hypothetical protein
MPDAKFGNRQGAKRTWCGARAQIFDNPRRFAKPAAPFNQRCFNQITVSHHIARIKTYDKAVAFTAIRRLQTKSVSGFYQNAEDSLMLPIQNPDGLSFHVTGRRFCQAGQYVLADSRRLARFP